MSFFSLSQTTDILSFFAIERDNLIALSSQSRLSRLLSFPVSLSQFVTKVEFPRQQHAAIAFLLSLSPFRVEFKKKNTRKVFFKLLFDFVQLLSANQLHHVEYAHIS